MTPVPATIMLTFPMCVIKYTEKATERREGVLTAAEVRAQ